MTPPGLFSGARRHLLGRIIGVVLAQAVALSAAAFATRRVFFALHSGAELPVAAIATVAMAGLCAALLQLAFRNLAERLGQDYARDVRLTLFEHASRSDQKELDQRRMGYHVLRFTGDLAGLKDWPGLGVPRLVQAAILLPASTAVLIHLDARFVWVALCAILPPVLWAAATQRRLFRAHRDLRKRRARLAADVTERLPIAPRLAALGRRHVEMNSLRRQADQVLAAACARRNVSESRKAIPELSAAIAAALTMLLGSLNDTPAGTIAAALATLGLMVRPMGNAMSSSDQAARFRAAYLNLVRALNRPLATPRGAKAHIARKPLSVEIAVRGGPVLKLPAGQRAVISSALMNRVELALLGNATVDDISLKLEGKNVSDLTPGSLRRSVGVLSEQPLILKGSLRRALTLGLRPRPSDGQIMQTARATGLRDVISNLGGLDFKLAERGANLTAQQRLGISCLRLALQKPGLILVRSVPPDGAGLPEWETATTLEEPPVSGDQPPYHFSPKGRSSTSKDHVDRS